MIEIKYNPQEDTLASRLSNLHRRKVLFRDKTLGSIEAGLQAMKFSNLRDQEEIYPLYGITAQRSGQGVAWNKDRYLYDTDGNRMKRGSECFELYIEKLFDAFYPSLQPDLLASGHRELRHSIGKTYQYRTVLTRNDFLSNARRLRDRAHREEEAHLSEIVCRSF